MFCIFNEEEATKVKLLQGFSKYIFPNAAFFSLSYIVKVFLGFGRNACSSSRRAGEIMASKLKVLPQQSGSM